MNTFFYHRCIKLIKSDSTPKKLSSTTIFNIYTKKFLIFLNNFLYQFKIFLKYHHVTLKTSILATQHSTFLLQKEKKVFKYIKIEK